MSRTHPGTIEAIEGSTINDWRQRGIVEYYVGVHSWSRCQVPCTRLGALAFLSTMGNLSAPFESSFHGVGPVGRAHWKDCVPHKLLDQKRQARIKMMSEGGAERGRPLYVPPYYCKHWRPAARDGDVTSTTTGRVRTSGGGGSCTVLLLVRSFTWLQTKIVGLAPSAKETRDNTWTGSGSPRDWPESSSTRVRVRNEERASRKFANHATHEEIQNCSKSKTGWTVSSTRARNSQHESFHDARRVSRSGLGQQLSSKSLLLCLRYFGTAACQ